MLFELIVNRKRLVKTVLDQYINSVLFCQNTIIRILLIMDKMNWDELLLSVMDSPRPELLNELKEKIASAGNPLPEEIADHLETLWEEWNGQAMSVPVARFLFDVAQLAVPETSFFRKALIAALKVLLPPFLNHAPIVKATGVRDENVPAREAALRFSRLIAIKNGCVLFLESSRRWGVAGTIDSINATLPILPFGTVGSNAVIPLDNVLKDAAVLASGPDVALLVDCKSNPISPARFRAIVEKRKLVSIPESRLKLMAQTGCGRNMASGSFEKYWNADAACAASGTAAATAAPGTRRACNGRSLAEVDVLLDKELEAGCEPFTAEEITALQAFFERLKPETAKRESKLLAGVIAKLSDRAENENLKQLLSPLTGKTAFWPENPAAANFAAFEVWGELPSKLLEKLSLVTSQIFDEDYLAACALRLPLKALNCLCARISDEALCDMVSSRRNCGADLLLWIWKNRKKRSDAELLHLVNLDNVSKTLGGEEPPKAWRTARRELRAMLLDDATFQSHMIDMFGGDIILFGSILQSSLFLSSGERQSLMVKLARQSPELQEYLESGAGQKILNAGIGKNDKAVQAPVNEPTYTSVKSHKLLMQELDDIINIHVPENREALKTARAHGDFRENSEFDAAKERRNYLSRRRSELEKELANIQPVVMKQLSVSDTAIIGSEIELEFSDGKKESYYLLGAWDGNPDKNCLSYRTRLGKALLNHKIGDTITGADDREAKIVSIRPLPAELIAELDA